MWRWKSDSPLLLWIGAAHWVLRSAGQELARGEIAAASPAELASAIRGIVLPGSVRGQALQVIVDDRWCRSFVVQAPSNVQSAADLALCMQARMEASFGDNGAAWSVLADRRAAGRFAACAIPTPVHEALIALTGAAGAALSTLTPLWVHVCQRAGRPASTGWLAVQADATTTLVCLGPHGVAHVRTLISPQRLDAAMLQRCGLLERGRAGLAGDGVAAGLRVVSFDPSLAESAPAAAIGAARPVKGIGQLDFAAPRGLWRWPGWRLAWPVFVSVTILMAAGMLSWLDSADSAQAEAALRAALGQPPMSPPLAPVPRAGSVSSPGAGLSGLAVAAVVQRLNMPWPSVLDAFEKAAGADVTLLSLSVDTQRALVRATALARDEAAMFDYVRQLNAGAALEHARVTRHAIEETAPGQPVQFVVESAVASVGSAVRVSP